MTLEVTLWAIPAASLLAASVLIVLRAWRLTRESAVRRAILARAAALSVPREPLESPVEISIAATARPSKIRRSVSPPAPPGAAGNPRLCPVPIIVCRPRRQGMALAS